MRFHEIILEASVLQSKYGPGSPFKVSSAAKGQALESYIKSKVKDFDASDVLLKVFVKGPFDSIEDTGIENPDEVIEVGQQKSPLFLVKFDREDKSSIILLGKQDIIEGGMIKHYAAKEGETAKFSASVKGLVAEALLGVAMYAKLTARGGDLTAPVNEEMIWGIIDGIKPKGDDEVGTEVHDRNSKISDHIRISIKMRTDVQSVFTDPKFRPSFTDQIAAWVKYVNSDLAQQYADVLYKNQRPDNISILLAGKAGEKMDVAINVLDKKGNATRKHEQVKLSVKLSDGLMGQVGRGDNPQEVYANLVKLFNPLGVDLSGKQAEIMKSATDFGIEKQFVPAARIAYMEAHDQLLSILASPNGDALIAAKLANLADAHSTGHDDTMHVIEKHGDQDYRLLNYKGLSKVFQKEQINLVCDYSTGESSKTGGERTPMLTFYDKNNSGPDGRLLKIWVRGRGGEDKQYANTVIEPGKLLKELAAFRRFRKPSEPRNNQNTNTPNINNLIKSVIMRNQLDVESNPILQSEMLARAKELFGAGHNHNQVKQQLISEFPPPEQQPPIEPQIVQPVQQPIEPVQQEPVQQEPTQPKQRLGHLRQGSEEESEPDETPQPSGFYAKYGYPQKYPKKITEELFSILKNAGIR